MSPLHRIGCTTAALVAVLLPRTGDADTVYLKNGAWIDGRVRARNEKVLQIEIGKIGKLEIDVAEVHEIEKNNRTGDDLSRQDARELQRLGLIKEKQKPKDAAEEAKDVEKVASDATEDTAAADGDKKADKNTEKRDDKTPDAAGTDIDPALKARIEQLVSDLQRQKPQFRVRAERHLKAIGAPAIPFILPLRKNESDLTRIAALRLLSDIGDESVIEGCIECLLDSNEHVRDLANKTLERVTHENFGFQAQASPRRRELAQEKWKKWWDSEKDQLEKDRALISGAGSKDSKDSKKR